MTSNTFTSAIGQVATHMIGQVATMRPGGGGSMPLEEGNVAQLEEQNFKFLVQEWKAKLNIEQLNPDDLESVKAEFAQALLYVTPSSFLSNVSTLTCNPANSFNLHQEALDHRDPKESQQRRVLPELSVFGKVNPESQYTSHGANRIRGVTNTQRFSSMHKF